MSNHWIVYEGAPVGCTIYERVDYVPTGSRVLAEEIDGKPKSQAVLILEQMFDRVKTRNGSPRIFCYKENGMPNEWKPQIVKFALAMQVLVVAKTRIEGAWSAYCDAVSGIDHNAEMADVLRVGDKLPESIARAIFPEFADLPYAP